jgi:hypothetical protein
LKSFNPNEEVAPLDLRSIAIRARTTMGHSQVKDRISTSAVSIRVLPFSSRLSLSGSGIADWPTTIFRPILPNTSL